MTTESTIDCPAQIEAFTGFTDGAGGAPGLETDNIGPIARHPPEFLTITE